ncbi:MAG: ClpXP protease specificity-enhancing factor [Betaproteobacteria bacterium]|nr:ClpXP protease specificity-enhancing factor [Betaproteobacteria bacterium]
MAEPTSTKPYLMRAIYEWCVDNGLTPYVSVVVDSRTRVPMEYVRDGEIVLNIGPLATSRMQIGNEFIECSARFSGSARELHIPITAVAAIYARENGHGMTFETESKDARGVEVGPVPQDSEGGAPDSQSADGSHKPPRGPGGKPTLRRVK